MEVANFDAAMDTLIDEDGPNPARYPLLLGRQMHFGTTSLSNTFTYDHWWELNLGNFYLSILRLNANTYLLGNIWQTRKRWKKRDKSRKGRKIEWENAVRTIKWTHNQTNNYRSKIIICNAINWGLCNRIRTFAIPWSKKCPFVSRLAYELSIYNHVRALIWYGKIWLSAAFALNQQLRIRG